LIERSAIHMNSVTVHNKPVLSHGGLKNSRREQFSAVQGLWRFFFKICSWWLW